MSTLKDSVRKAAKEFGDKIAKKEPVYVDEVWDVEDMNGKVIDSFTEHSAAERRAQKDDLFVTLKYGIIGHQTGKIFESGFDSPRDAFKAMERKGVWW